MKHQLQTIRTGLEAATCYTMLGFDAHSVQTALTALSELERLAGEQVQLDHLACIDDGELRYVTGRKAPAYDCELYAMPDGKRAPNLYAAPVAQQYEAGDVASAAAQGFRDGVASVAQQPSKATLEKLRAWETSGELIGRAWSVLQSQEKEIMRLEKMLAEERAQQPQAEPDWINGAPHWSPALAAKVKQMTAELDEPKQPQAEPDDEILKERDDAEDFIDMLLDEVLGTDRPEWTSAYGRDDALRDVQERMTALHKPMVDKAWERFEKTQQPQARPDFTDEWTGYLKDGETPFERFLRERKDLQSVLNMYQRVLEENERLKAQQPQAEAAPGYVLVPAKPTPEMWHAWDKSPFNEDGDIERNAAWSAMLKAAPQQAEAVPPDVVRDAAPIPAHELVTMYDERPTSDLEMIEFAREVERRHGIGVQPQHTTDGSPCWCNPDVAYTDPETGASVIVHRRPQ